MCARAAYYESAPRHSWSGQSQHHLQQHGCASARRSSLGWSCWSSCSWKGISKHSRGDHPCPLGTGVKPPAQKENVEGEKRSQVNMCKVHERAGNRKKTGFGSRGPGIIQQARSLLPCGMHWPCSSPWTLPWCPASPCPAALQPTAWWLQSVGLQWKRRRLYCRNPILCSKRFFFFLSKRLIRLNKENGRHERVLPRAVRGWGSAEGVSDAGQV